MTGKLKFIELNYHCHHEFSTPGEVIDKHRPSNLFAGELKKSTAIILVKHLDHEGEHMADGIRYRFFRSKNRFTHIPFKTHRFIKKEKPDIVLVQGFIFPLQVIALRLKLGKKCRVILQHQGELPFRRKKIFQRIADRCVNAYLFTSIGIARIWIKAGVIKGNDKCYELPNASTTFSKQDKEQSQQQTGMAGNFNFLWVGRLNANKDPLTVLTGFEKYFSVNPESRLYMIYQENDLLENIRQLVHNSQSLKERVILVGEIMHKQLEKWYSAADYFVSGSHREGGSYALMEAIACGCIPIVTNIPAAVKMTGEGKIGYFYTPGEGEALFRTLRLLKKEEQSELSKATEEYFRENLSPKAIAIELNELCKGLLIK